MRPIYNKSLFQVAGCVWMLARLTTAGYKGPPGVRRRRGAAFLWSDATLSQSHNSSLVKVKELLWLRVIYAGVVRKGESVIDGFIRFN